MINKSVLEKLERLEANAHRLLNDAAALKDELFGGSGRSNSKSVLSQNHKEQLIERRNRNRFKKK